MHDFHVFGLERELPCALLVAGVGLGLASNASAFPERDRQPGRS